MNTVIRGRGWIFSPTKDIFFFLVPALIFLPLAYTAWGQGKDAKSLIWVFLFVVPFDLGHIFATLFTVKTYSDLNQKKKIKTFMIAPMTVGLSFVIFALSQQAFISALVYFAHYHLWKQQYGWMMWSRRNFGRPEAIPALLDKLVLWNSLIFPFMWWQSSFSKFPKTYLNENDLILRFPDWLIGNLLYVHIGIFALYAAKSFQLYLKGHPVNWGKTVILLSTWLWYGASIMIVESIIIFAALKIMIHGVPYVYLTQKNFEFSRFDLKTVKRGPNWTPFAYGCIASLLWIFFVIVPLKGAWSAKVSAWEPFIWAPLILHYVYDSIIWRRGNKLIEYNLKKFSTAPI